jgi:alpha/beta superfamily hydrolase
MEHIRIESHKAELEGVFTPGAGPDAVVITHPHPLYGGNMDNHVVAAVERAFLVKSFSVLRFNFRGTCGSTGRFDEGRLEMADVRAAVKWVRKEKTDRVTLAGYSFGARVNAGAVAGGLAVMDHVMISPPVAFMSFDDIVALDKTGLIITGAQDDIAPPGLVQDHIDRWAVPARFDVIENCDHFYSGCLKNLEKCIRQYLEPGT